MGEREIGEYVRSWRGARKNRKNVNIMSMYKILKQWFMTFERK